VGCCIIGAIIISQLIALWRARRRVVLYAASLVVTVGLFAWQVDQHWHHIEQFAWDAQALLRGEDPAVAALRRADVVCEAAPSDAPLPRIAGRL
jgi:hypothetical protein